MAFQAAQGCASATLQYVDVTEGTHVGENVLIFEKTSTEDFTTADCIALANGLADWFAASGDTVVANAVRLEYISIRGLDNPAAAFHTSLVAAAGTVAGGRVSSNVSLAIQFRTGLTGRSNRGRAYLCGIPLTAVQEDFVTPTYGNTVLAAYEDINPNIPAGMQHVVLSRYTDGLPRLSAVPRAVTQYALTDLRLDTRRSRIT